MESVELSQLFAADAEADDESQPEAPTDYERELTRIHRQDDLFKMHTYRDGILSSRGAYILFPGDAVGIRFHGSYKNLFIRHPSAFAGMPEYTFPSVGAFELCPGHDIVQRPVIREFLRNVLEAVYSGAPYQEEDGLFKF